MAPVRHRVGVAEVVAVGAWRGGRRGAGLVVREGLAGRCVDELWKDRFMSQARHYGLGFSFQKALRKI